MSKTEVYFSNDARLIKQATVIKLLAAGNWINEKSTEFFKRYDLSTQQFNVLRILRGQKGEPANLCDVQERMISKMSNTTRLIEKLRIKGLLHREQCEENRRKIEIRISKKGLNLLAEIDEEIDKHENKVTEKLSLEELKNLNKLLHKLTQE
ncbi:MarR family winged helix-turn-helix transcriptional regulator [Flavicella sediminum]|uniref:MarR family winged helix-turn-helix transcriptional regulator n=1 Tax=Flavicella sediminum TaxID=2585141 RepID=UPI001123A04C|nr:MarR family transcriptional regulator [Flavicella sediminum]